MIFSNSRLAAIETRLGEARDIAVEARAEVRNHQSNCIEHNRRVEGLLASGRDEQERRHTENIASISALNERINSVSVRILVMIISLLASAVLFAGGALYTVYAHRTGML